MRVLIFGASGIIGQHMRLSAPLLIDRTTEPRAVEAIYLRRVADDLHEGCDLRDFAAIERTLDDLRPDVVVNLAGENRVDEVERQPDETYQVNVTAAAALAAWCAKSEKRFLQASTQAVFGGTDAPYMRDSLRLPVNHYGQQKKTAEDLVRLAGGQWVIVRPTFVLGIRLLDEGRPNPLEQALADLTAHRSLRQVSDRYFSPCFAWQAAEAIWEIAYSGKPQTIWHVGLPISATRHSLTRLAAFMANSYDVDVNAVRHGVEFAGLAPRPYDTTYGIDEFLLPQVKDADDAQTIFRQGMKRAVREWRERTPEWRSTFRSEQARLRRSSMSA